MLVDFDNLCPRFIPGQLSAVVEHLVGVARDALLSEDIEPCSRVRIRFYGGWYEDDALTRDAHALVGECADSSWVFRFRRDQRQYRWIVTQELAFSLVSLPSIHLVHTYRRRQHLRGILATNPVTAGCNPDTCRILGIEEFVRRNRCPDCGTPGSAILFRTEQKLVDVMLATDMLFLSQYPEMIICVVSSDDDFWPTLFHVSSLGRRIYHMHRENGPCHRDFYRHHAGQSYVGIPVKELHYNDR